MAKLKDVLYLPSGRIFISQLDDGYVIESTEMRDVNIIGKEHASVRETLNPQEIWQHLVPYQNKWLLTVSTQKGCAHNCQFCDCANLPFAGNLTTSEITWQILTILEASPYVQECDKVKIGFARMGEPSWNIDNVLEVMNGLPAISKWAHRKFTWLPCFNTILPKQKESVLSRVLETKESVFNGNLHLQISCNSTDEEVRKELFGGANVVPIEDIIKTVNNSKITNRTVTLNFIVMKGIEIDVQKLCKMGLNPEKFAIKLIPLNKTENAEANNLETFANYSNYEHLVQLSTAFAAYGLPVVHDAIAKCEEAGLCCGQLAQIYL